MAFKNMKGDENKAKKFSLSLLHRTQPKIETTISKYNKSNQRFREDKRNKSPIQSPSQSENELLS